MSPRLFFVLATVEARKRMSYRTDFWITVVVTFAVEVGIALALWTAIFEQSGQTTIGGLSRDGMVLYYVVAILLGKLIKGENRESTLAEDIYSGGLTRYLMFPMSYFAAKFAERLGGMVPALVQLIALGGISALTIDLSAAGEITAGSIARTVLAVALGHILAFLLSALLESLAFWADNVWSLEVLLRFLGFLLGGQMLPLHLFPPPMQPLLDWLPFRFFYYFPTTTLTNGLDTAAYLSGMGVAVGWCGLLALATRAAWRRGSLVYTGVGI